MDTADWATLHSACQSIRSSRIFCTTGRDTKR